MTRESTKDGSDYGDVDQACGLDLVAWYIEAVAIVLVLSIAWIAYLVGSWIAGALS